MNIFQWEERYDIGLPEIDAQHRTMIDMLNTLYAAKKSEQARQVVEETLDRLLYYTTVHFTDEEAAMQKLDYPHLDKQKNEHETMTQQVVKMRSRLQQGDDPVVFELLNFMSEWLKFHICESDRKFGDFVKERKQQL
ncbi:MAG: hemerythrin family protein [Desulfuromonadales bacterium]|nr:hemerythrin family protein [Desulfuromonadales bacterium]